MIVTIGIICSVVGLTMEFLGRHTIKRRMLRTYKMVDNEIIELHNENTPETLSLWFVIVKGALFVIGFILILIPIVA